MSASYRPVTWNRYKLIYDLVLLTAVVAYVCIYIFVAPRWSVNAAKLDDAVLRMRAFGTCAFLMLSLILCIGPLARLDRRFLPLLYNRRHFGVLTFMVALTHASQVLGWYYAFSPVDPYVALLSGAGDFARINGFPFELLGVVALLALAVLAATSHDFWLSFLSPPVWKAIHMSIYAAWAAIVAHVALGAMLAADNASLTLLTGTSVGCVTILHLLASRSDVDSAVSAQLAPEDWLALGSASQFVEGRGRVFDVPGGERVAVFMHRGALSAMSNACAHQNGPLGEGRILDGCVTCPWHGFQYRVEDGCAPPPFTEKLATYELRWAEGIAMLNVKPLPPGTRVEPLQAPGSENRSLA